MKKILFSLALFALIFTVSACTPEEDDHVCEPEIIEKIVEKEVEKIVEVDLTPAPEVTGTLYHWMHGAVNANVEATLDFKKASKDSLVVAYGTRVLVADLEYDLTTAGKLTIYGDVLESLSLEDGDNEFLIITNHGLTKFVVVVVDDPTGTTIPTKDATVVDMGSLAAHTITAPIANQPALLITEMGLDDGVYSYIEVFNNSAEEVNLKGKRIVIGQIDQQSSFNEEYGWLISRPLGMDFAAYIYQDYKIPALSSALVWFISTSVPWEYASTTGNRAIKEIADAVKYLVKELNGGTGDLSVATFKAYHGLGEDTRVFPVRKQHMYERQNYQYNPASGFGLVMIKTSPSGFNTSTALNRTVQIYDVDQTTKFPVTEADIYAPAGSTHYRYVMDVLNKEEEVYANGTLDNTKITPTGLGPEGTSATRESIGAFYFHKVYLNASGEVTGRAVDAKGTYDVYSSAVTPANDLAGYKECATPIVTAIINQKLTVNESEEVVASKWGAGIGLEYTLPAADGTIPHLMRFVLKGENLYETFYKTHADLKENPEALMNLKLSALTSIEGSANEITIQVPVNAAYPTAYLDKYILNTAGKVCWFNFGSVKP